jgi:ribosomal protein S18 acetylase RimI-like enzyme
MTNILIRECTHQDLEGILELDKLWNDEGVAYVWYGSPEDPIEAFERFPKYFLLAESDGCIVGYVNASVRANETVEVLPKQQTYLEVENIYVRSEFRGMRVGGDLIERLLEVAKENGIERFVVSTVSKDTDGILRFYRSYGFKPWYVELFK